MHLLITPFAVKGSRCLTVAGLVMLVRRRKRVGLDSHNPKNRGFP